VEVEDRAGVLATIAQALADRDVSIARLVQQPTGDAAVLHVVTHRARWDDLHGAAHRLTELPETRGSVLVIPVVSDRGVAELGWE
jgi:homoserine dehydrogenase